MEVCTSEAHPEALVGAALQPEWLVPTDGFCRGEIVMLQMRIEGRAMWSRLRGYTRFIGS